MGHSPEGEDGVSPIDALSPFDGRYRDVGRELAPYFSEGGLIRARFHIESRYLLALSQEGIVRPFTSGEIRLLESFDTPLHASLERVKQIETKTHHDVQAAVVFLKEALAGTSLADIREFVHFGLTSEDVNNLAWRVSLLLARNEVLLPSLGELTQQFTDVADAYKALPMLGRTHGQPAIPTTFGKEVVNFAVRLQKEKKDMAGFTFRGKLNGAIGNFNALSFAYPRVDWPAFSDNFIRRLGFEPNHFTTQVNPNDDVAEYLQMLERTNAIIHGFDKDMWRYISDEWVLHKPRGVGSSTMPQKINPIDFEHSEGMTEIANGMIGVLTARLVESRLQRDLSDTSLFRFLGDIHAASVDAWRKAGIGLDRSMPNVDAMHDALRKNWAILSEPVQLLLRQAGVAGGYEAIRTDTQGKQFSEAEWKSMIDALIDTHALGEPVRTLLRALTPDTYIGQAVRLTEEGVRLIREEGHFDN